MPVAKYTEAHARVRAHPHIHRVVSIKGACLLWLCKDTAAPVTD